MVADSRAFSAAIDALLQRIEDLEVVPDVDALNGDWVKFDTPTTWDRSVDPPELTVRILPSDALVELIRSMREPWQQEWEA